MHPSRRPILFLITALLPMALQALPTEPGMYAVFTTSSGSFTAVLHHDKVPTTVANFAGLAEGSRTWIDGSGLMRKRPYYDGTTFHRVINGFMIQGGSPNGTGTDGPGYGFADEFHPDLRHNAEGVLSMANSGANTNGSQFFITLAATSHLDNKHSVFGRIVEGMAVVRAIGATATDVNDKPLTPVVIQSVTIHRVGASAQTFDVQAQGLPVITNALPIFRRTEQGDFIELPTRPPMSKYGFAASADLAAWTSIGSISETTSPGSDPISVGFFTADKPRCFFHVARVAHPAQPLSLVGKRLSLVLSSDSNLPLVIDLTAAPRSSIDYAAPIGNYLLNGSSSGAVGAYLTNSKLHSMQLVVALETIDPIEFNLAFRDEGGGYLSGRFTNDVSGTWPLFGSFTVSNIP
jgi:cyclophilin family peptidyl-prolyl cis-trans isomerase